MVSVNHESVDLRYIEDTGFHQGFLDRLLGIGTVTVSCRSDASRRDSGLSDLKYVRAPRRVYEMLRALTHEASKRMRFVRFAGGG
ncbi:MAG: hypothetical protein HY719_10150 [Planctomycetes bacterium]|nr:hypothetical protein [Planctomycetota bacterium]